ncbi:MAG: D-amino-acid transaminase [Methylocystis sp.]|nr:D-amino-acid transaminase [Methylocystis sp.]MCA3584446.1 D-amino-acid transaminase [Methylocystis sp.]MCA3587191.1 D-amino-acid transaminase [Methylocystis sp.]MCA3592533.1 D-amino-acid transaminase [Methylocystis sp.]
MSAIAYVNGQFVPQDQATISIMDRGFLFADGIYEVSAVLDGKLVDNDLHMARLERSVGEIELPLPLPVAEIAELMRELVVRNRLQEGLVYLQVTRGADATRSFPFPANVKPTLVMFIDQFDFLASPKAKTGIKVKSVEDIRWARRDIKSVALLAQVLAKQAAAAEGCHEAWMHEGGIVTEGGSSTAYIVKGEGASARIVTRENSRKILPGCTRHALLDLVRETGIELEERAFTVEEAYAAKEAFVTSATNFVMPVTEIDGRKIGGGQVGPVARRLRELYIAHARKG